MEFGTFSSPESASPSPEKKKDTDSSKEKKKKSAGSAAALAEIATEKSVKQEQPEQPEQTKRRNVDRDEFWKKIKGETTTAETTERPLFGIPKPELVDNKKSETKLDATTKTTQPGEQPAEDQPVQADDLIIRPDGTIKTDNENDQPEDPEKGAEHQIAINIVERRLLDLPEDEPDTPVLAANKALLQTMRDKLQSTAHKPVTETLDEAERVVTETIDAHPVSSAEASAPLISEAAEHAAGGEPDEAINSLITDTLPEPEAAAEALDQPASSEGSAEIPPASELYETAPPSFEPPIEPGGPDQPGGPYDGNFGSLNPHMPPYGEGLAPVSRTAETATAVTNVISTADALHNERAAQNRGLLTGGLVGYFVGRHRGRRQGRAQAESRARPVQHKLEQNIKQLEETIADKQRTITAAAREKAALLVDSHGRKQLIDSLLRPNTPPTAGREKLPSAQLKNRHEMPAASPSREETAAVGLAAVEAAGGRVALANIEPTGQLYSRSGELGTADQPLTTELLINNHYRQEAHAAVGVGGGQQGGEIIRPGQPSEQASVVPFNKKAEAFSRQELLETAAKITVEGTSLKEMVELGRLDEPALRRVIGEFLEGGDVSAAVSREVKQKELKYERDPRMRQAATASGQLSDGSAAGLGSNGQSDDTDNITTQSSSDTNAVNVNSAGTRPGPTPDAATIRAIRNKQVTTIAGTTVLVAIAVFILIMITR